MADANSERAIQLRHGARIALYVLAAGTSPVGLLLAAAHVALDVSDDLAAADPEALAELEQRVAALEVTTHPGRRIPGRQARILEFLLRSDLAALWTYPDIDELMASCGLSVREAVEDIAELMALDLVHGDPNLNHASGLARARLDDTAYLRVGSTLLPDVPVAVDSLRLLHLLDKSGDYYCSTERVIETLAIPVPRFNLAARALVACELIEGGGSGGDDWGTYLHLRLLPLGRRVLRGDDPFI